MVRSRASSAARSGTARIRVSRTASSAKPAAPATEAQKRRSADPCRGSAPSLATASALVFTGYTSSTGFAPEAGSCPSAGARAGAGGAAAAGSAARTRARSRSPSTDPRPNQRFGWSVPPMRAVAGPAGRTTVAAPGAGRAGVQSMTPVTRACTSPPSPGRTTYEPGAAFCARPALKRAGTGAPADCAPPPVSRAGSKGPQPRTRDSSA